MRFGRGLGRIAGAALGFGLGGPMGGLAGAALPGVFGRGRGGGGGGGGGGAGENPADAARPYLNQIPNVVEPYYDPFIKSGREAEAINNPIYGRMAQNPAEFLDEIMRRYNPSEGYRFKEREMARAAQNSAAQGGFSGTRNDQMSQADMIRGLLGDDMQEYIKNILGIQGGGLQGQELRTERGYNASAGLADTLANTLMSQGSLGFQGGQQRLENNRANQMFRENRRNNMINNIARVGGAVMGIPGLGGGGGFFNFGG